MWFAAAGRDLPEGVEELSLGVTGVEWHEVKEDLARFVAPKKGYRTQPRVNPGKHRVRGFALKGREITVRLMGALRVRTGAPSGLFAGEIRFPGLKPWAESYSPFGARVAGTTLHT